MPVALVHRQRLAFSKKHLQSALEALVTALGCEGDTLCVLLTDDDELRALNKTYRRKDQPTDVLSFALPAIPGSPPVLGDLAISLETAARQAKEHGHDLFSEVAILCTHGLLHLRGYDHEASPREASRMLRRERSLLRGLGIERDALTARGKGRARAPK